MRDIDELSTKYVKEQILVQHAVAQAGTFIAKDNLWSDMPPACAPEDIQTPWLSIKWNLGTPLRYETDQGGRYLLEPDHFLILNHNHAYHVQPYTADIPHLLCVFFPPGWVEDVLHSLVRPNDYLLDNPLYALSLISSAAARASRHAFIAKQTAQHSISNCPALLLR